MSATATPTKRRVLGSLDANVQMSPRSPGLGASPLKKAGREPSLSLSRRASPSPRKQAPSREGTPRKRPLEEAATALQQPAVKKLCSDDAAGAVPATEASAAVATTTTAAAERQQAVQNNDEVRSSHVHSGFPSRSVTFDHRNTRRRMTLTYRTERTIRVTAYHCW